MLFLSRFRTTPALASCLLLSTVVTTTGGQNATDPNAFDWSSALMDLLKINPSTNLSWVDCFQPPLQCARFSVPLNYSAPDTGSFALALTRVPSPLAGTSSYRGPVLFNPGGPGASGVLFARALGLYLQQLVGQEFDLISFDPRGVGDTTPPFHFFESDEEEEQYLHDFFTYDISPESWSTLPGRLQNISAFNALVINKRAGNVLQHVTTDNVARDMLGIMEAHGREKLQYYGISYGTILGSTFASMFPDKVERLLIDGVADPEEYFSNNWITAIVDADKTIQLFFEQCTQGEPEFCDFYEASVGDAVKRWEALLDTVEAGNITLNDNRTLQMQEFIPYVHVSLYTPVDYPKLAQSLRELEQGNSSTISLYLEAARVPTQHSITPIRCTDVGHFHDTLAGFEDYWKQLTGTTRYFARAISMLHAPCYDWAVTSHHFRGPTGAQNTSFPLMVIGNIADPVTPLASAKATSALFPGSRLLVNNVPGHASLATRSKCVAKYIRQYFVNGTLPEEGAFCDLEAPIFTTDIATVFAVNDTNSPYDDAQPLLPTGSAQPSGSTTGSEGVTSEEGRASTQL